MKVRNTAARRAIILPSDQRLAPGEEGEAPNSYPIMILVNAGELAIVQERASNPIAIDISGLAGEEDQVIPPTCEGSPQAPIISELLEMHGSAAISLIDTLSIAQLQSWIDLEKRKTVSAAIEKRIRKLGA